MKLNRITLLVDGGGFKRTAAWARIYADVELAVAAVQWPPESGAFTIYPERDSNGVKPIKAGFIAKLKERGWKPEERKARDDESTGSFRPGAFDAWLDLSERGAKPFVVEWETGNISSSHRAVNKMALGIVQGWLSGGLLVLPSRDLYKYLTDRVGNYRELEPYFPMWTALDPPKGLLGIVEVEHDGTSTKVRRVAKGTDGRALI